MNYWPILILAIAISVDGFSVGITYGLRKIRISIFSLLIISSISAFMIFLSGCAGAGIAEIFAEETAKNTGNCILIGIGSWMVFSTYKENIKVLPAFKLFKILQEPIKADLDNSGNINFLETLILGLALALDALGAGLGTGLSGFSPVIVPFMIGIVNFIFVGGGFLLGKEVEDFLPDIYRFLPGFIIIFIGLIKLL